MVSRDAGSLTKGAQTKQQIVDKALALAGAVGLEALSLGSLAQALGLSKSGLFAHFQSKEALQVDVLKEAIDRFSRQVVVPALAAPRGRPRLEALLTNYLGWLEASSETGGCIFMSLSHEFDDRPGPVRDLLAQSQRDWIATIARVVQGAIDAGHFQKDLDPKQFAFELEGLGMAFRHHTNLLGDQRAAKLVKSGFDRLLAHAHA